MWNCLEFCCMLYKNRISWNLCCHFRWQTIFLCFYCNIYEMKPDIFEIFRTFSRYLEKNRQFLETYLGDFWWYLYLGLRYHWFPHEITSEKRAQKCVWAWVVCLIDRTAWEICFNQSEALPRSGKWRVISVEFLRSFVRGRMETSDGVVWLMSVVFLTPPYDAMAKALQP